MAYMVSGNKFNPYTFEEMIKPVMIYKNIYDEYEKELSDLLDKTAILDMLQNNPKDNESYQTYKNFSNALNKEISNLYAKGLDTNSKNSLMNLKQLYGSTIRPIELNYQKREELDKEWRHKHGDDPTWIGTRPSDISLDIIGKGDYSGIYGVSGENITNRVANIALISSQNKVYKVKPDTNLLNEYLNYGDILGYNENERNSILNAVINDNIKTLEKYGDLYNTINGLYNSDIFNKLTDSLKLEYKRAIVEGLERGLMYKDNRQYTKNPYYTGSTDNNVDNNIDNNQIGLYSNNLPFTVNTNVQVGRDIQDANAIRDILNLIENNDVRSNAIRDILNLIENNDVRSITPISLYHPTSASGYKMKNSDISLSYYNKLTTLLKKYGLENPYIKNDTSYDINTDNLNKVNDWINEQVMLNSELLGNFTPEGMKNVINHLNNRFGQDSYKNITLDGKLVDETFNFDNSKSDSEFANSNIILDKDLNILIRNNKNLLYKINPNFIGEERVVTFENPDTLEQISLTLKEAIDFYNKLKNQYNTILKNNDSESKEIKSSLKNHIGKLRIEIAKNIAALAQSQVPGQSGTTSNPIGK